MRTLSATNLNRLAGDDPNKLFDDLLAGFTAVNFDEMFNVQLGKFTEAFNIQWMSRRLLPRGQYQVVPANEIQRSTVVSRRMSFDRDAPLLVEGTNGFFKWQKGSFTCRPDAFVLTTAGQAEIVGLVEAKHVSAHFDATEVISRYMPQVQATLHIMGLPLCTVSVIYGNARCTSYQVPYSPAYWRELEYMADVLFEALKKHDREHLANLRYPPRLPPWFKSCNFGKYLAVACEWADAADAF